MNGNSTKHPEGADVWILKMWPLTLRQLLKATLKTAAQHPNALTKLSDYFP